MGEAGTLHPGPGQRHRQVEGDGAPLDQDDAIRQGHRLADVVGDEQGGESLPEPQPLDEPLHPDDVLTAREWSSSPLSVRRTAASATWPGVGMMRFEWRPSPPSGCQTAIAETGTSQGRTGSSRRRNVAEAPRMDRPPLYAPACAGSAAGSWRSVRRTG